MEESLLSAIECIDVWQTEMQDKIIIYWLVIAPLKMWQN